MSLGNKVNKFDLVRKISPMTKVVAIPAAKEKVFARLRTRFVLKRWVKTAIERGLTSMWPPFPSSPFMYVVSIDEFVKYLLDQAINDSPRLSSGAYPAQSPAAKYRLQEETSLDSEAPSPKSLKRQGNGGSLPIPPQLLALAELEFKKAFPLLSYITGKSLGQVITADEIRRWKDLPMIAYEPAVWDGLGWL